MLSGVCLSAQTNPDSPPSPPDSLSGKQINRRGGETVLTLFTPRIDSLKLPDELLFFKSEKIFFDNLLADTVAYRIDYKNGILYFRYLFRDAPSEKKLHRLEVRYRSLPLDLKPKYFRREIVALPDSVEGGDTLVTRQSADRRASVLDDLFAGTDLRRSGSLVRGITVGSNQDLTVNSGFRLQLEGTLVEGVDVAAALTDENTPIQPEGNTQTLQEFDRVFIELRSKNAKATIGDFNILLGGTEFASVSRRLQGAKVEAMLETGIVKNEVTAGVAASRGKYNVNQFNGLDGVQGPYRLTGRAGEPFIIVLAGTEKVFVNGELMVRGQTNDYVIEYGSGELIFQPRRLITAQSRISVDFEYTDRLYARTFLAARAKTSWFNDRASFQATFLSEGDDENSPIDVSLTDANKALIAAAGADRFKAVDTSAFVGRDSVTGRPRGSYVRVDSTISSGVLTFFRFAAVEDSAQALWAPSFAFVGDGLGSYRRRSFGIYEFAGKGAGSYEAFRFLPIPQGQNLIDLALYVKPIEPLSISLEGAITNRDLNKFSRLDDSTNLGRAYKVAVDFSERNVRAFGVRLGELSVSAYQRSVDRDFQPIDRTLPVDFNRDFNLIGFDGQTLFNTSTTEVIRNLSVAYKPALGAAAGKDGAFDKPDRAPLTLFYRIASNRREDLFNATRQEIGGTLRVDSLTSADYTAAFVTSENASLAERSRWLRQTGRADLQLFFGKSSSRIQLVPFVLFEVSDKKTTNILTDTLRTDSHEIVDVAPGLRLPNFFGQTITASYGIRSDKLFISDNAFSARLEPASVASTLAIDWLVLPAGDFNAQLNFTQRLRKFTEVFRQRGNSDNESLLLRLQTRYTPLRSAVETDFLYEVTTEKTSRLDRQYFQTAIGFGSSVWADANRNGAQEFSEFIPIRFVGDTGDDGKQYILRTFPSDELVPTIDLKSNLRLRLRPERLVQKRDDFFLGALAALSSETLLRVEEKSTERDLKQIYLLNFDKFQNDSTTIVGSFTVQQDFFLFETGATNVRFRFQQRTSQSQFSLGGEKRLFAERSVRFVSRAGYELGFELNLTSALSRVTTSNASLSSGTIAFGGRDHRIDISAVTPDISYRPFQDLELGLRVNYEQRRDNLPADKAGGVASKADINSAALRGSYSLRSAGRIGVSIERIQTVLKDVEPLAAVYELTNGNAIGTTLSWRAEADYRINNFITASFSYDGRALPLGRVINTGRAEVRAVF